MSFFNSPLNQYLSDILLKLINNNFKNINSNFPNKYIVIVPNQQAKLDCIQALQKDKNKKFYVEVVAISETEELLKIFQKNLFKVVTSIKTNTIKIQNDDKNLKYINNSEQAAIFSNKILELLNTKAFSINTKAFLFSSLIKDSKLNLTTDSAFSLAKKLIEVLDILKVENINNRQLQELNVNSTFNENLIELIIKLRTFWDNFLSTVEKYQDSFTIKTKAFTLLSEIISSNLIKVNIIAFAIDSFFSTTINLLRVIANYKFGKVIFNGINFQLSEDEWENLPQTHPQYSNAKTLKKLNLTRKDIKPLNIDISLINKETIKEDLTQPLDLLPFIFNKLPYKSTQPIESLSSSIKNISYAELKTELEEASLITHLVKTHLKENSNETITIVTTNLDLVKYISFQLAQEEIPYDNSFGIELARTSSAIFFKLISTIDTNNINFVDLLGLLKHPLCSYSKDLNTIYLIDLYLARKVHPNKTIKDYLFFLDNIKKNFTDNEYHNIKNILQNIEEIYKDLQTIKSDNMSFYNILYKHIKVAEKLTTTPNGIMLWQGDEGISLKEFLDKILEDECFLKSPVSLQEYNNILNLILKSHNIRKPFKSDNKVFIKGILQAEFSTKNIVILADLNENSFPTNPKQELALIKILLSKINLLNNNISKEALIFNKLCYCKKVYLTRSIKKLGTITTPSRFLTKLQNTLANNKLTLNTINYLDLINNKINKNFLSKSSTKIIEANPKIKYRPKVISNTSIEKILQNPYVFYIEKILKLNTLSNINPNFNSTIKGNLIHNILHILINNYKQQLKTLESNKIAQILSKIADEQFKPYLENYPNALLALSIFKNFTLSIAKELVQLVKNNKHLLSEKSINVDITYNNLNLTIKVIADCIAIDNYATIIDFKTGNSSFKIKDIKEYRKQLIVLGYILLTHGLDNTKYNLKELEYWTIPNNFTDKLKIIKLKKILKEEDINEYVNKDFNYIKERLYNWLGEQTPFTLNLQNESILKEYKHFSRRDDLEIR